MDPNNVNGMIHVGMGSPYMLQMSQNQMLQQQYQLQLQQQMMSQSVYQEVSLHVFAIKKSSNRS
jgi:hypothetical protein